MGVLRRSTGRVSRRSPRASADEALQLPIGLPLLPGNFRPFASLKRLPWFRHVQTCVSRHRPPGSLRLREPLAGWNFLVSGSLRLAPRCPPAPSGSCHRARLRVVTFPTLALEARPPRERDFRPSSSSDPRVAALGPVDWVAILGHSPYPRNNVQGALSLCQDQQRYACLARCRWREVTIHPKEVDGRNRMFERFAAVCGFPAESDGCRRRGFLASSCWGARMVPRGGFEPPTP